MPESRLFRVESENEQLKNKNQKLEDAQVKNQELEATQGKLQTKIQELETAQSKLETRLVVLERYTALSLAPPVAIPDNTAKSKNKIDTSTPLPALQAGLFFRRLPPEIREMIWKLCLPGPRAVRARRCSKGPGYLISSAPIPMLLHLCNESRKYALKTFSIVGQSWNRLGGFYFDERSDFLHASYLTCHNPNWFHDGPKPLRPLCRFFKHGKLMHKTLSSNGREMISLSQKQYFGIQL